MRAASSPLFFQPEKRDYPYAAEVAQVRANVPLALRGSSTIDPQRHNELEPSVRSGSVLLTKQMEVYGVGSFYQPCQDDNVSFITNRESKPAMQSTTMPSLAPRYDREERLNALMKPSSHSLNPNPETAFAHLALVSSFKTPAKKRSALCVTDEKVN